MPRSKSAKSLLKQQLKDDKLIETGSTFCMIPWIHLHTSPTGIAAPCCIAKSCGSDEGVGNSRKQNLMEIVNSDKMKYLRLDMMEGMRNAECTNCYAHEEQGVSSFRKMVNEEFKEYYDDVINHTNPDGSLSKFKMRYFDIRFNNICNFKCRTCGSGFSTQWEQEDLKHKVPFAKIIPKNNNPEFLEDVINQIDHMKTAYFAGGEPLITEEHYILLEEMIRRKKTDIHLRYNTNLSNIKFKDKDLLSLWKHFTNRIDVYASIDHYGERAEYIRHGTDWALVESNFITVKKTPYINLQTNTVLSVFNCLTFYEFWSYLIDKDLYMPKDSTYSVYNMATPPHLTCHILPQEYKEKAKESMEKAIKLMKFKGFDQWKVKQLEDTIPWIFANNTWEQHKKEFRTETKRLDSIRGESFTKTFPELGKLIIDDRKLLWPV